MSGDASDGGDAARRAPKFPLRLDEIGGGAKRASGAPAARPSTGSRPPAGGSFARGAAPSPAMPSGLGLDSAEMRRRMAQRLRQAGVTSDAVIEAMATVPRHAFVDAALVAQAYEDTSLPIGHGQTISKPSVVARMIDLLMGGANARASRSLGRTLEIGTGCGYQAAVLATLARSVVSVERLRPLHDKARALLAPLRRDNLRLVYGDGMRGHPPNAPYDSIVAAAGGDALPQDWLDQLAVGGRLVAPMRQPGSERQALVVVDRTERGYHHSVHEAVHFVPLKSGLVA